MTRLSPEFYRQRGEDGRHYLARLRDEGDMNDPVDLSGMGDNSRVC